MARAAARHGFSASWDRVFGLIPDIALAQPDAVAAEFTWNYAPGA
ncbi:hypothetical protein CSIRO_4098 [Bradyrhizobiaceae bacterium SG-6C]|nr:hypothetical protein CSIRO_4098 [Bradyrhizobiaceae bacterium SG-6C]